MLQQQLNATPSGDTLTLEDRTYIVRALRVPSGVTLAGPGTLHQAANTNASLVVLEAGAALANVALDGGNQSLAALGQGLVYARDVDGVTVDGVTFENVSRHAIYLRRCTGALLDGCTITDAGGEAIYLHGKGSNSVIQNCNLAGLADDGIKVHSHDGTDLSQQLDNVQILGNTIDYSSSVLASYALAIEIWRGDSSAATPGSASGNCLVDGNIITGPATGQGIWGVSLDNTDDSVASNNAVTGGQVIIGYENAGGIGVIFDTNALDGFTSVGISISRARAADTTVDTCSITNAATDTGTLGIQMVDGGSGLDVLNCDFLDAGERAVFFNGSGDGGTVDNCTFAVDDQATMDCVYLYQVDGVTVTDNSGAGLPGIINNGTTNVTQSGNTFGG